MNLKLTGLQLINGRWAAAGGESTPATNPTTGVTLEPGFVHATEAEVDAAMTAARDAFHVTRDLPAERRAQLLGTIADKLMELGDALLERGHAETGLPLARLTAERARTCGQLKSFAALVSEGSWVDAVIDTADPDRQPLPKPDVRRVSRPIGPVIVFGAGNFPFAFGACGGDTASALAAGNPVVVKAHGGHPGVNELCAHAVLAALKTCELPAGLFALLQGPGRTVGQALVKHPAAQAVGFTGSKRAGRLLFDLAAARPVPIPVFAEMGSLNPLVILPGALAARSEVIAAGLAQSVTMGVGQFCTKPGLVFVAAGEATDKFISQLTKHLTAVPAGTMLDAGMKKSFCAATDAFSRVSGVKSLVASEPSGHAAMSPLLFETDSATWRTQGALHEEAFGPATIVIRCRDFDDLLQTIPLAGGNLTATIHHDSTDSPAMIQQLARTLELQAGRVVFNGFPTGVEVCHAMVHGGPYPATSAPATTSVGTLAIQRFVRPVCFQNAPDNLLPLELQNANPRGIWRTVNGQRTRGPVQA